MQLRTSLRLNTAVEAMTHVIIPALDPDNGPAHEQAALVVGMLTNAIDWLPYEHAFDRAELSSNREALAQTSDATEQTAALIDLADDVLLRSSASPGDVLDCVRALPNARRSAERYWTRPHARPRWCVPRTSATGSKAPLPASPRSPINWSGPAASEACRTRGDRLNGHRRQQPDSNALKTNKEPYCERTDRTGPRLPPRTCIPAHPR
jgi:hypothetical protein